jgi:predicted HicB family RNase H-like nuclease
VPRTSKTDTLNLRIDPALKEAAARAAASDRRSLTAYIEKLIEDDIRMRESSSPRKPKKGQAA